MSEEKTEVKEETKHYRTLEEMKASEERYRNRKFGKDKPQEPPTEEQKEYNRKIKAAIEAERDYSLTGLLATVFGNQKKREVIPYPLKFEDAKQLFTAIMQRELSVNGKEFVVESENREKFSELVKYFTGHESKLNPNKGVYLYGPVGRGKTLIMQSLMVMCAAVEKKLEAAGERYSSNRFQIVNAKSIVNELAANKKPEVMKRYYSGVWCIDDFGAEDGYKLYGNDLNVVGDIIVERYQRYQQSGLLTHATSNIMPEEWKAKYGDRVESRLHEMFNVVKLLGEDKRKA